MSTNPVAAEGAVETGPGAAREARSKSAIGFAIGFPIATALTVLALFFVLSGGGLTQPGSPIIFWLLGASLAICLVLAGFAIRRIVRVVGGQTQSTPGAKLHLRFVSLFSLAALAPAIVVALFMGVALSQGLENWFSQRVAAVIDRGGGLGRYMVSSAQATLEEDVRLMATDLNRAAAGLRDDPRTYGRFLAQQAEGRSMAAAYVIDHTGHVLARAESQHAPAFHPPASDALAEAGSGRVADRLFERESDIRVLMRLTGYADAYLYVVRAVDPALLHDIRAFADSVASYHEAERRQPQIKAAFALAYLSTAFLVLLGAIWLGLSFATRISEPMGRLASAAQRVTAGDLGVRVALGPQQDEISALGASFNRMTAQLETQRRALVAAQQDAETRSRFIEAVLGGVSAGVIGLDRDGRIVAANRSAAQLIGHGDEMLVGRRLVDVAPEFGELLNRPTPQEETPPERIDLVRESFSANLGVRMSPDGQGGLVLTFDDMTKLISAQRQEAWKDVARRIAHEIKNPLTPIQLSAERLRKKYGPEITSDPDTFQKCTDTILRQVADIGRMVDEFSSFARMPTPRMAFADMSEIARSVVFSQRISFADVRVDAEGVDHPIGLVCDERLIAQALLNLIKNAAESVQARRLRDGEPKDGFVLLRVRDLEYGVHFEVIDNGLGFPAQNRERLIEPYVTTRAKGAGLGLAIVARVVEDHGGLIELDDAPGAGPGAVVRFVLPKRGEEPLEPAAEHSERVN